ncbi:hypothetical protein yc1106_09532 [Curvularia clavata]|uniref:Uncharacterized protein n=1 Tax=Curvularia clavata TaxID=95742 RepID=A0A9Q8ZKB7_CURCL|nr:hypothetical protein yc1106_09532 [Curvularia clavata]
MGAQPRLSQQRLLGKKLDSTLFLVVNRIYRILWIQDHRRRPEPLKIPVEFFTTRLLRRVRESIREYALEDPPNLDIDWECRVFRPIIATLDLTGIMDVCETDAEYILLLSTTLALGFELLLLAGNSKAARLRTFLARAFEEFFVEPDICVAVENVLEVEQGRLAKAFVNVQVVRAIQHARGLLPDNELCTAAWKKQLTSQKPECILDGALCKDGKGCMSRSLTSRRRMSSVEKRGLTKMHYSKS